MRGTLSQPEGGALSPGTFLPLLGSSTSKRGRGGNRRFRTGSLLSASSSGVLANETFTVLNN